MLCSNGLYIISGNGKDVLNEKQHQEWTKLGCIRGITLASSASKVFSSAHWIKLFLRIVGGNLGESNFCSPANAELKSSQETKLITQLPRQVNFFIWQHSSSNSSSDINCFYFFRS